MGQTKCGCGRSNTGYCTGLHKLTNEEWNQKIFEIDFDKVNTLEDVKAVLDGLRILFNPTAPAWDELKPFLKPLED